MKIISDFKDYYDSAQYLDREAEPVYMRTQKELANKLHSCEKEIFQPDLLELLKDKGWGAYEDDLMVYGPYWKMSYHYVGFCGTIYTCVRFALEFNPRLPLAGQYLFRVGKLDKPTFISIGQELQGESRFYAYNAAELLSIFQKSPIMLKLLQKALPSRRTRKGGRYWRAKKSNRISLEQYLKDLDNVIFKTRKCVDPFVFYNVPIFVVERGQSGVLLLNADLDSSGFRSVFQPDLAFQEISMFLTNELCKDPDVPQKISDKDMIAQKGFDPIYGFRTPPTKKKQKKGSCK